MNGLFEADCEDCRPPRAKILRRTWEDVSAHLDVCEAELVILEAARRQREVDRLRDASSDGSGPFAFFDSFLAHYGSVLCTRERKRIERTPTNFVAMLPANVERF